MHLALVALLPLSLKLMTTYPGAILVGTTTNYNAIALVFGASIWFSALGIILPVTEEPFIDSIIVISAACKIKGTYGEIMKYVGKCKN